MRVFADRREAGKELAKKLSSWAERDDVVVLALPRGGVPVGFEVARFLHAPFDLMLVRKLGAPGQEELAMGAVAMPDIKVFNHDVIRSLAVPDDVIEQLIAIERRELMRRNFLYRGGEPPQRLTDRIVIIVDDGMATGANMRAAVSAVKQQQPKLTIVAIPVSSGEAFESLQHLADSVVSLETPEPFYGVGQFYRDFPQLDDNEVMDLLEEAKSWGYGSVPTKPEMEHAGTSL